MTWVIPCDFIRRLIFTARHYTAWPAKNQEIFIAFPIIRMGIAAQAAQRAAGPLYGASATQDAGMCGHSGAGLAERAYRLSEAGRYRSAPVKETQNCPYAN